MALTPPSSAPNSLNQAVYPGAGDVDDCWVVATIWCAHMFDPKLVLPTIPQFRKAAGVPDKPGPTGGTIADVLAGATTLWPDLRIGGGAFTWAQFDAYMDKGLRPASVQLKSGALPAAFQYHFTGIHQVGVVKDDGHYWLMDPLAPNGSPLKNIHPEDLRKAMVASGSDGKVRFVLFPLLPTDPQTIKDLQAQVAALLAAGKLDAQTIANLKGQIGVLSGRLTMAKNKAAEIAAV